MDDICGAMIQLDLDGKITFWNNTAENMLGYCESEVIGSDAVEKIFINNTGDDDMIKVAKSGEVYYSFDSYVKNKDGDMQPVALVTSPLNDETGSLTGVTILVSNVLMI